MKSIVEKIRNPPEGHAVTMTESTRQIILFWKGLAEGAADEIEVLRQYGNKDCTAMADEVLNSKGGA